MNTDDKCILLAKRISKIFSRGIRLNKEVAHFINSTFSSPELNELEKLVLDRSDPERDSLLELIFFPDEEVQAELEDLLQSHQYCREDEKKILNELFSKPIETKVYFSNSRDSLNIKMPDEATGRFLARLNIHRKIDKRIFTTIETYVPEKLKIQVMVKLRNAFDELAEHKILFLCGFFEKMDPESRDYLECLDFILSFLDETENTSDLFRALMNKKKLHHKNLHRTESFRQRLEKTNMETIILQGVKAPYIDIENEKRKIELVDKISLSVFGRTEYLENSQPFTIGLLPETGRTIS
jgi:hypothetical protein